MKKHGSKPKTKDDPVFTIISEANKDLEEALEIYEDENAEDFSYVIEKVSHASGLLKGTVLIMEDRK